MELPKRFKKYQHLIDVIRTLIYPNYLKTKKEQLKWYVYYVHDDIHKSCHVKNYIEKWHSKKISFSIKEKHYDLESCSVVHETEYQPLKIDLDEEYVHNLLSKIRLKTIEYVLKNTIVPDNQNIKYFIENDVGRKIYPLDKNCLFQQLSFEIIRDNPGLFDDVLFGKCEDNTYITIKTDDYQFRVGKNLFDTYCHFNDLIKASEEERINTITAPFTFSDKSSKYFLDCLTAGKFLCPGKDIEEADYDEFKQLMLYFQVSFV